MRPPGMAWFRYVNRANLLAPHDPTPSLKSRIVRLPNRRHVVIVENQEGCIQVRRCLFRISASLTDPTTEELPLSDEFCARWFSGVGSMEKALRTELKKLTKPPGGERIEG